MDKLLPIGTIVRMEKESKFLFMIVGYMPRNNEGEMRDYAAVRYPMGVFDSRVFFFFNHKDIEEVVYQGFENEDYHALMEIVMGLKAEKEKNINNLSEVN